MADQAVAWFEIRIAGDDSQCECQTNNLVVHQPTVTDTHSSIEICGNEQFILGRDPEHWYKLYIPTVACVVLTSSQPLHMAR
jgi:hypothetical protein